MNPTGTIAEPKSHAEPGVGDSKVFGTRDDLLRGPELRTKEVYVARLKRTFCLRELRQVEVEEIASHVVKQDSDAEGKITSHADSRGYKARCLACALVDANGNPLFGNPMVEYLQLNAILTPDVTDQLFNALDELSVLTEATRKKLGKGSGTT